MREEDFDLDTLRRVEERKTHMLEAKSTRFAEIQARRIKTMRQVSIRCRVQEEAAISQQTWVGVQDAWEA